LFKNAAEANTESPARIGVETSTVHRSSRPSVQLSVTDNGGGIEPELLERLFEPYVSSKPKGTGLGLAIVKKIVEEHNGVVWAENPAAGGARLVVQLPATVTTPKHGRLRDATTGG
jgi:signal transduction histidine kinase